MISCVVLGADVDLYREQFANSLYQERLMDALAEESELSEEAEHASIRILFFDDETQANVTLAQIASSDFVSVWNTVRSTPPNPEALSAATATERLWQTQDALQDAFGAAVSVAAFDLELGEASQILVQEDPMTDLLRYYIIEVTGREVQPLSETALNQEKQQLLTTVIDEQLQGNYNVTDFWRSRVPTLPALDDKFLSTPTPAPQTTVPAAPIPPLDEETIPNLEETLPDIEIDEEGTGR